MSLIYDVSEFALSHAFAVWHVVLIEVRNQVEIFLMLLVKELLVLDAFMECLG